MSLGLIDGVDNVLWSVVYASILFSGGLTGYLAVGSEIIIVGWMIVCLFVALTSPLSVHIANTDDQAVLILAPIAATVAVQTTSSGGDAAGLSTLLAILAATTISFSVACFAVAAFGVARLLDLVPFPVICGFMASVGWLMLNGGVEVATGLSIRPDILNLTFGTPAFQILVASAIFGIFLWRLISVFDQTWILPVTFVGFALVHHLIANFLGVDQTEQITNGWLIEPVTSQGSLSVLSIISFGAVDLQIFVSALPTVLAVVALAVLHASIMTATLKAQNVGAVFSRNEFRRLGIANLLAGLVAAPPGYTDAATSSLYEDLGAKSRLVAITAVSVGAVALIVGTSFVYLIPKSLIAAGLFMFGLILLTEWLFGKFGKFATGDKAIVLTIVGFTIWSDFLLAVGVGLTLSAILFGVRSCTIDQIGTRRNAQTELDTVERSNSQRAGLAQTGGAARTSDVSPDTAHDSLIVALGIPDFETAASIGFEMRSLTKGSNLFAQGGKDDGVYVLASGILSAWISSKKQEVRVETFLPGAVIGDLSGYLTDKRRTSSVRAESDCEVWYLSKSRCKELEDTHPLLSVKIHKLIDAILAERINHTKERFMTHED